MDEPNSASHAVFIDTTLDTHLALLVSDVDNVSDLKKKVVHEHLLCFPEIGEIKVEAMRVEHKGCFYHLSDTMLVKSAFSGVKGNWFLSVVGSRIPKCIQKDPPSDPMSSSLLAHENSNLQSDEPLKLAICDALSPEQMRSQFVSQNDLNPGPLCPDSAKNILNDMEMEVEHDNDCKTSSSERSEHGMPEQSKQTGEGMIMLGGYAESKDVSAANVVIGMHSGESLDGNNITECEARKKQKVGRKDEDELLGHALNVNDTSADKLPQNTTEAPVEPVHGSIDKSEEALNSPKNQSNDEPKRSSPVTSTQEMDTVKIDQLNDKDITLHCEKVSREVSKSVAVKKKRKAQKLSGSGGLLVDREAAVSNTLDDSRIMPTSDDHFAARNSVKGRKKKKTKSSCLQEVPTGISSLRDARGDSSKGTLEIENKVPDEEPETFQRSVKTNSEPEAITLGEMGSHHHDQDAGNGDEQRDMDSNEAHPGNAEHKDAASKLSRAKDHQVNMTDVPAKHNLSHTDKILSGTTEVAGSFKIDASGLSKPSKSGKKSKSKKTTKLDRDRQAASGFGHEDGLMDANTSIENHKLSSTHPKTSKSTDQACQTDVGGELLQKSNLAVDLPHERRASERENTVVNTTEVDASPMMDLEIKCSEEPQKSGKKRKTRKAADKSGRKTHGKPDPGNGDGVFSAIASIENHRDSKNDTVDNPLDQTEDRRKFLHESGSELVLTQKLEAYDTDNIDVNAPEVASSSKLDAVLESQKSSKIAKSKKIAKAGGAENASKDNKPIDQTQEESGVLPKICPDLVLSEYEASVLEKTNAGTTEVGRSSKLDANEVQEPRKSGKKGKMKKAAKSGGEKRVALGMDHEDGMVSVKAVCTAAVREKHLMNENTENFSASSSTSKGTVRSKEKKVDHYKVTAKNEYGDSKGETVNCTNQKKSLLSISGNIFKDGNDENSEDNGAESDASTRTPSDNYFSSDSEVGEYMDTPVKGTQGMKKKNDKDMKMSGLKDMALDNVLRCSSRFKKAKLSASQLEEDTESQTVDIVPDSQAGL